MSKLQSILSANAVEVINSNNLSFQQVKAVNAIASCRTSRMGSHKLTCNCGHEKIVSNSCGNRHCPNCGSFKKELWVHKQQQSLLPTHYFHLVFTVPDSLRQLIYYNQKLLYNLMYKATSKTILELTKSRLDATPGFSLILHTWSQTLMFHPHLHCVLAGGGLSSDQSYFKAFKKKFFLPIKMLSMVYKGKFLQGLKDLLTLDKLVLTDGLEDLKDKDTLMSFLDSLYKKDWVVFSKSVFKCAAHVLGYLGRYTHKVAISDYRIIKADDLQVSFSYKDNRDGGKKKTMVLSKDEFIRRFLLHVLPYRFTKIRHYGFLSNRFRSSKVALCRNFISKQRGIILPVIESLDKLELLLKLIGKEKLCCPECGNYYTYQHKVYRN